eukprot:m.238417 g.238417  ORF g.238417 m.238417 type:complete len:969 (+) comp13299_c0_seq1:50-2956(+)
MAAVAPEDIHVAPPAELPMQAFEAAGSDALHARYENMSSQMERQSKELQRLMESQRVIEEQQAKALAEDRKAIEERFKSLDAKLAEQAQLVTVVQQQQNHIIKLINIQDKLAEQDRQLRMFFEYQQNFLATLQSPMSTQATVFQELHTNQTRMLQALSSVNMPMPRDMPDFSMSYAIPAALGELPQPAARKAAGPAELDPATKYTNVPERLGGMKPFPYFDADEDAKRLRKAIKGLGTDNRAVISIIGNRTCAQRQQIAQAYKTNYQRDLLGDLKDDTSGNFRALLVGLMQEPAVFDAHQLHGAVKGLGTNDTCLIDVLCTRTNDEIKAIKEAYKKEFSRELEGDVRGDTSGDYQNLLCAVLRCTRDESNTVDLAKAKEDAASLYNAGEGKVGTATQVFITIMTQRNYAQLRAICDAYEKLEDYDLEKSIARETSFNFRKALVTIVAFARSPPACFAERLHTAMYGVGTNSATVTRILVARAEVDLKDIALEYKRQYKSALHMKIRAETSGNYRSLLIELFGDHGFNPEVDAKNLRSAMKGLGNRKSVISKTLAARSGEQRQAIMEAYAGLYKRDMVKDLEGELSGDYKDLVLALLQPLDEFLAREVFRTIKGIGTDDNSLVEILCSRSGFQMRTLKEVYSRVLGRDLASDVRGDTSGDYQRLLLALIYTERDDSEPVNAVTALDEARRLYRAGEDRLGTQTEVFIEVMTRHSLPQTAVIFEQYNKLCDYDIEKSISRETSYDFKRALMAIVLFARDPAQYYAKRLHATMAGAGTQDRNLIRIIVERCEKDLRSINDAFFKLFKQTLETTIKSDTSGWYCKLLLLLLDHARHTNPPAPPVTMAAAAAATVLAADAPPEPPSGKVVPVLTGEADKDKVEAKTKKDRELREAKEKKEQDAKGGKGAASGSKGAPPKHAGITITTGQGSVTLKSDVVEYDYDGDGKADYQVRTPAGRGSTVTLDMGGDTKL